MIFGLFKKKKTAKAPLRAVSMTDTGLERGNNEDHLLVRSDLGIFCVADGMGGGADGEKASQIVCAEIAMMVRQQPPEFATRMESVCNAVIDANNAIYDYSKLKGLGQMGTTVSILVFDPDNPLQAAICHVGDSRIYRFRRGELRQLTRDHSVAAEIGRKLGSEFGDRSNPLAHVLTRAVGTGDKVNPDWKKISVEPGDRYLLCTDGVHDLLDATAIAGFLAIPSAEDVRRAVAAAVVGGGAHDNYSFIIVDVEASCC